MREDYKYAVVAFVFGILNIVGTTNPILALFVSLLEYVIVFYFLFNKDFFRAFIYYLLFTSVTIEMETFIYGDSATKISYNFFQIPLFNSWLCTLIIFILALSLFHKYKSIRNSIDKNQQSLVKWMVVLLISGVLTIFYGMVVNDNNIISSPNYPKMPVVISLAHFNRLLLLIIAITFAFENKTKEHLVNFIKGAILGIGLSSCFGLLLGYNGWYGDEAIMLTPISIFFAPFLILFFSSRKSKDKKQWAYLFTALIIIFVSFNWATPIGSKWYILFFLALLAYIIYTREIKSAARLVLLGVISIAVIVILAPFLISLLDLDSFMGHKIGQLLGIFVFNDVTSADDWYSGMSNSPLYRFDEVANTFIEYLNKPGFFLFGKGFAGTTLHYTNLLSWETDPGAFSDDQIRIGAYYAMHESFAAIFLRHGIIGIVFFFAFLYKLIKAMPYSPWAMIGFTWLFFYWAYGSALIFGPVAIILALSDCSERLGAERS